MNGDKVQVELFNSAASVAGKAREGRIIKVVERANNRIVGMYSASRNFAFVSPDDTRIKGDIYIPKDCGMDATTGAKVVVEITQWPEKHLKAEGKVVEVLGQAGAPGVDILSIRRKPSLRRCSRRQIMWSSTLMLRSTLVWMAVRTAAT